MSPDPSTLTIENVTCRFETSDGPILAVEDASLQMGPGDLSVVQGASGSGKTTLLLAAGAMLTPQSGRVLFDDQSLYDLSVARRTRLRQSRIASLLPTFQLLPYMSAKRNVMLGVTGHKKLTGQRSEVAVDLLKRLGLGDRMNHRPDQLSTGERRRVMMARALASGASVILADEPTANLDEENASIMRQSIQQHVESGGSALVVTHEPIEHYNASQRFEMSHGKLERRGSLSKPALIALVSVLLMLGLIWALSYSNRPAPVSDSEQPQEPIRLLCAAGIMPAIEATIERYEQETGRRVTVSYGGSGTLLGQLEIDPDSGDLYLAADDSYIVKARDKGLVRESIEVAFLTPVIAVQQGNPSGIQSLRDLLRDDVKVGLANPGAAAVGRISKKTFTDAELWDSMETSVKVFKPTVNEVAADLALGTIDATIVWDATVRQYDAIDAVSIPELERQVRQVTVGLVSSCERSAEALHFARYLAAADRGGEIFEQEGYEPASGDQWADRPELLLYAGSMFNKAVETTLREFEEREGVQVDRIYNGCGILVSQMNAGGAPDAYLACDQSFMDQVSERFSSPQRISSNAMVLAVRNGNPMGIQTLDDLLKPELRVGLSHPKKSALGALTEQLLAEVGVLDDLVASGNWKQEAPQGDFLSNALRTGALDAVIVYRSNVESWQDDVDIIPIDHPRANARQPAAIAAGSQQRQLAQRLLDALRSSRSEERFEELGFVWEAESPEIAP